MERIDPCDNCLINAMCSDVCYPKRWQIDALSEAMDNNIRASHNAQNQSSQIHYKKMFRFFRKRYLEARERENIIMRRRANLGLSSSPSGSTSSQSSSSWRARRTFASTYRSP